jgi:hypothetical protein
VEPRVCSQDVLTPPEGAAFYRAVMERLHQAEVQFLVGGAFAFHHYTGIGRSTKDFDLFVRRADWERALGLLEEAGYAVSRDFPHWLGKAHHQGMFVDLIFNSGNGVAEVDDGWFDHAAQAEVLGVRAMLCPAEEMLWSKAFIMERERYDGADVAHLLRCTAGRLDWERLLRRFGDHWRVLLAHLVLFGFVYPDQRRVIPPGPLVELLRLLAQEQVAAPSEEDRTCRGTVLSRLQYLADLERWGYRDARLEAGTLSPEELELWTQAALSDDERRSAFEARLATSHE